MWGDANSVMLIARKKVFGNAFRFPGVRFELHLSMEVATSEYAVQGHCDCHVYCVRDAILF